MSIKGCADRDSTTTHTTATTTATIKRPMTLVEPQPHVGCLADARIRATSHAESKTTPAQLIFRGANLRLGNDEMRGDHRSEPSRSSESRTASGSRARHDRPARTMPSPAPAAANAAMTPIAPITFSFGNSSRMSPKDRERTPHDALDDASHDHQRDGARGPQPRAIRA